ncbi:phosphatidylinositol-glycan biosynthesis class F protein [Quillaja saponaria]|uniref:Phosphatidylinositol-glycan biosynthesis class F protein n=1 Tax=Quillaja saponaria TaxID=32244 RepID=A0AAD7PPV5_QUISA|nr:phosphatidylinositol-glycan biosynthesis class F protein [Quillaja saponaria]
MSTQSTSSLIPLPLYFSSGFPLVYGYGDSIAGTSLQSLPTESPTMLLLEGCRTRHTGTSCWGSSKCFWSHWFGRTYWHSTVPAAFVFGSSWTNWQSLFANTRFIGSLDYMISIPAHGAAIGAWLGHGQCHSTGNGHGRNGLFV